MKVQKIGDISFGVFKNGDKIVKEPIIKELPKERGKEGMKEKQIKLTAKQIEIVKPLFKKVNIGEVAFREAAEMLEKAREDLWCYLEKTFPEAIDAKATFSVKTYIITYYE